MKKIHSLIALALLCTGISVFAQEQAAPAIEVQDEVVKPNVGLCIDYRSKYYSKGRILNPDAIIAADAAISYYGFAFDVWSATDLTSYNDVGADWESNRRYRFEEIDYTIAYGHTFEDVEFSPISVGAYWMYMDYPGHKGAGYRNDSAKHETEFGLGASLDNVLDKEGKAALAFGTDLYINLVDSYCFGDAYADYSYAITEKLNAGLRFTAYWYSHKARAYKNYWFGSVNGIEEDHDRAASGFAIPNIEFKPYLGYEFNDYVSAQVYAASSIAVERTTRAFWGSDYGPDGNHSENYWFGAKLGVAW